MHVATVTAGAWRGTRLSTLQTLNTWLFNKYREHLFVRQSRNTRNCGHKSHNAYCAMGESSVERLQFPVSATNLLVGLKTREVRSVSPGL